MCVTDLSTCFGSNMVLAGNVFGNVGRYVNAGNFPQGDIVSVYNDPNFANDPQNVGLGLCANRYTPYG